MPFCANVSSRVWTIIILKQANSSNEAVLPPFFAAHTRWDDTSERTDAAGFSRVGRGSVSG